MWQLCKFCKGTIECCCSGVHVKREGRDEEIMEEYEKRGLAESSEEPVEDELDFEEDEEMAEDEMPMA